MSEHDETMQQLKELREEVEELKEILLNGTSTKAHKFLKVREIAQLYNLSYSHVCNNPILLPRCGDSDYSPKMWTREEVEEWLKKPKEEKETAYKEWQLKNYKKILEGKNGKTRS